MGCMLSFVLLGSLALQTSINKLGTNIIVAHTAARRITILFLIPFFKLGAALSTFCGQNKGARKYDRIDQGVKKSILVSAVWCVISVASIGYMGVIVAEPIVWAIMVIPLIIGWIRKRNV